MPTSGADRVSKSREKEAAECKPRKVLKDKDKEIQNQEENKIKVN